MDNQMFIGTRGFMGFVPCPDIDGNHSKFGWSSKVQYLNGGAGVRNSTGSHKEYNLSWNVVEQDSIRRVLDLADGIYDSSSGVNPIYFLDPMVLEKNVLPQMWASPIQTSAGGLTLFPGQTPSAVPTPANSLGYPARSVVYSANTSASTLWIPIPPNHTAWVGSHGSATGSAGVTVATTNGLVTNTPTVLTMLDVTDSTRFNHSVDASGVVDGIQLGFVNVGPTSTDQVVVSGQMVQIIPTGFSPEGVGGFISGQGNAGCQFDGQPSVTPHSVAFDLVGVNATLVETASWF